MKSFKKDLKQGLSTFGLYILFLGLYEFIINNKYLIQREFPDKPTIICFLIALFLNYFLFKEENKYDKRI